MGSGIFGEFNAMKGLWWECGTVSDMNFLCYNITDSMFNIPTALLILQFMVCLAFSLLTIGLLEKMIIKKKIDSNCAFFSWNGMVQSLRT
jgi:hypothetical protein